MPVVKMILVSDNTVDGREILYKFIDQNIVDGDSDSPVPESLSTKSHSPVHFDNEAPVVLGHDSELFIKYLNVAVCTDYWLDDYSKVTDLPEGLPVEALSSFSIPCDCAYTIWCHSCSKSESLNSDGFHCVVVDLRPSVLLSTAPVLKTKRSRYTEDQKRVLRVHDSWRASPKPLYICSECVESVVEANYYFNYDILPEDLRPAFLRDPAASTTSNESLEALFNV